jgi:ribosome-associated toxin RatA of RatAB toxin-antitoxin module
MSEMSSSTIIIEADLATVSATLFEIEKYPEWSGAIKKVEVLERDEQARALKAKIVIDAGALKDSVTLTYDWSQAPARLEFNLEDANMLTKMDGAYILKSIDSDTTSVTYELEVAISMPIPAMMIRKQEKTTIDQALAQLKSHLEE